MPDRTPLRHAALVLGLVALLAVAVDLGSKAAAVDAGGVAVHDRSTAWAVSLSALVALEAAAILAARSRLLALAGGVLVGGCAANLASVPIWGGVPDPLAAGGVYTNVADVLIGAGLLLLVPATAVFAARNRARLRGPVTR